MSVRSTPCTALWRPGSTHRCRPRSTAPRLPASRTRTLVPLPRKLWGSCKPTRHVGRALGEQCCFMKTQQFQHQKRWPHTVLPSHSEPTPTARIKIRAAPSAPRGLGPAWGPGACVPHKLPPGLGQTEAGPQLPPPTPRGVGGGTEAWALSSPHTTGSWHHHQTRSGWTGTGRREQQPAGHRKTKGSKTNTGTPTADSHRPTLRAELMRDSQRPPDSPEPLYYSAPREGKGPGGGEGGPSPTADTLQG